MAGLLRDTRFAVRQLRRNLGFTIAATVILAVAICANSTIFSWINGTMLHPIPGARHTDELVSLMRGAWSTSPTPPLSYLDYRDLRDQNHSLTGLLAYHSDWIALTRAGAAPQRVYIGNVSANFFDVLGVKPLLGRFFLPGEETRPDAVPYVVLAYSLWKTRYAGDPQIVGKAIEIARHPVTVIGVAPEGFIGAAPGLRDDAWLTLNPLGTNEYRITHRSIAFLIVLGRLRPGVSREQATQDLETIMRRIVAAYPNDHLGTNTITLDPMWRSPFGANVYMADTLPILLAIAGVVLLLTCANVATLMLVRFVSRRREIAIRQSLGAQRVQLVRQMVLEGVILSAGAGAVALWLTSLTAKTFARFIPANSLPIALNGTVDQNVVLGIVVLAALASVLSGALPAWRSSNVPASEALKDESSSISGGSHNRRLLSGLVVAQISLSLALLVISALLLQTLRNLSAGDPGFEQDHVLTASVGLYTAGYSDDEVDAICHKILDRVAVLPTVTVASLTDWMPMNFNRKTDDAYPEGYAPRPHESLEVQHAEVTPRYFETLGVPILEGRDFARYDDRKVPPVAIVDQTAAKQFWPGQDPVGKRLHIGNSVAAVIGVVKNTRHEFMNERPEPMVYISYFQRGFETIVQVRTQGNPNDIAPAVESAIHGIDGQLPVFDIRSMRQTTQMATIFAVMQSTFAGILAAIALILATAGIYGVVAYRTALRTHEIGIRVALGASPGDVLRLVLLQGLSLTAIGLSLGLALSFSLAHFIAAWLYGVGANDPLTVIVVVVLLGAMSVLACYFPARRATRVDPVAAIRAS
jgi:predicted permease